MLLSDIESMTRQDLFDTGATRWSNSDIDRAIDKTVDRYTAYAPNIVFVDYQMQPYQRTYPYPQSWNPAYPVLWIEKIFYPLQVYGSQYLPPTVAPTLAVVVGAGLGIGTYQYLVTFLTQGGETPIAADLRESRKKGGEERRTWSKSEKVKEKDELFTEDQCQSDLMIAKVQYLDKRECLKVNRCQACKREPLMMPSGSG